MRLRTNTSTSSNGIGLGGRSCIRLRGARRRVRSNGLSKVENARRTAELERLETKLRRGRAANDSLAEQLQAAKSTAQAAEGARKAEQKHVAELQRERDALAAAAIPGTLPSQEPLEGLREKVVALRAAISANSFFGAKKDRSAGLGANTATGLQHCGSPPSLYMPINPVFCHSSSACPGDNRGAWETVCLGTPPQRPMHKSVRKADSGRQRALTQCSTFTVAVLALAVGYPGSPKRSLAIRERSEHVQCAGSGEKREGTAAAKRAPLERGYHGRCSSIQARSRAQPCLAQNLFSSLQRRPPAGCASSLIIPNGSPMAYPQLLRIKHFFSAHTMRPWLLKRRPRA